MWSLFDADDSDTSDDDFDPSIPSHPLAWTCELCAFVNEVMDAKMCEVCEYPRSSIAKAEQAKKEAEFIESFMQPGARPARKFRKKQTDDDTFESYWHDSQSTQEFLRSLPARRIDIPAGVHDTDVKSNASTTPSGNANITDERVRTHLPSAHSVLQAFRRENRTQRFSIFNVLSERLLQQFEWPDDVVPVYFCGPCCSDDLDDITDWRGIYCSTKAADISRFVKDRLYVGLASAKFIPHSPPLGRSDLWEIHQVLPCYMISVDGGVDFPSKNSAWYRPVLNYKVDMSQVSLPNQRLSKLQRQWNWRVGYGSAACE